MWQNAKKMRLAIEDSFDILILSSKTQKNMRFTKENLKQKFSYNCMQFPYLNFNWQNAKKHAFCNGKQ